MSNQIAEKIIHAAIKEGSKEIDLSNLRLSKIPVLLLKVPNLQDLTLSNNTIRDIELLTHLTELRQLQIDKNQIKDLSPLANLSKLESIIADYNFIDSIDCLASLPSLKRLTIEINPELKDISILAHLDKLEHFSCLGSPIVTIENMLDILRQNNKTLPKLTFFDLTDSYLDYFSEDFFTLVPNIKILYLSNTHIKNIPPEIYIPLGNGLNAIKGYFQSLKKNRQQIVDERVRVILIGNGSAGKSTLAEFLKTRKVNKKVPQTHGILHFDWKVPGENYFIDLWDFGGQEYYHNTHRLFFRKDCLYILAWDPSSNKNGFPSSEVRPGGGGNKEAEQEIFHLHYWLSNIKFMISEDGEIPESKYEDILIVQTKGDEDPEKRLLPAEYYRKFRIDPAKTFQISVYDKSNPYWWNEWKYFEFHLIDSIQKMIKRRAKVYKYCITIRNHIQLKWKKEKMIYCSEFMERIRKELKSDPEIRALKDEEFYHCWAYLDSTGAIMHFKNIDALSETIFLNPIWISDMIYEILSLEVKDRNGIFDAATVIDKVKNPKLAKSLLELLGSDKFDLALRFKLNKEEIFIAPQYLSNPEPEGLDRKKFETALVIQFRDFFPKSFLTKVIIKFNNFIKGSELTFQKIKNSIWKDGFFYTKNKFSAIINLITVREGLENESINYKLNLSFSHHAEEQDIVYELRSIMDLIYSESNMRDFLVSTDDINFVKIANLEEAINLKQRKLRAENGSTIPMTDMLKKVFEVYLPEHNATKDQIFISYTHRGNKKLVEKAENIILKAACNNYRIWKDSRDIQAGEIFENIIKEAIRESSIFVLLLCNEYFDSLHSDFIVKKELPWILRKIKAGGGVLIPICLSECSEAARSQEIGDVSMLPQSANGGLSPMRKWTSRNNEENTDLLIKKVRERLENFSYSN